LGWHIGVGIRLGRPIPLDYWCFVEGPRFLNKNIWPHIFPFERDEFIDNRVVHRDNLRFDGRWIINRGVGIDEISRWTGSGVRKPGNRTGCGRTSSGASRTGNGPRCSGGTSRRNSPPGEPGRRASPGKATGKMS
jgi:hypothetical protein